MGCTINVAWYTGVSGSIRFVGVRGTCVFSLVGWQGSIYAKHKPSQKVVQRWQVSLSTCNSALWEMVVNPGCNCHRTLLHMD